MLLSPFCDRWPLDCGATNGGGLQSGNGGGGAMGTFPDSIVELPFMTYIILLINPETRPQTLF